MVFGSNKEKQQQLKERRRREAIKTEMEDIFGDMMDEMGM